MRIGHSEFDFARRVYVMGVLNVTPDSFSDGGRFRLPERALEEALRMQEEGAALIDVGAESSRPGARPVSPEEERRRLMPVLRKIVPLLRVPVSVDTRKAAIAQESIQEGAALVNDISALRDDSRMGETVAKAGVPVLLMHMRGEPATMQRDVHYLNVVAQVIHFLKARREAAVRVGIPADRILVDPGLGFGKTLDHNLEILKRLAEFKALECPVAIGASRKSFVRNLLQREDPLDPAVLSGSVTVAAIAAWNGAALVRVHDVRETVEALRIVEKLKGS